VAVFLAIGGLLVGGLWSSFFVANPTGMVQERKVQGSSSLIPQAEGADLLYGEGALKDPERAVKTTTTAASNSATKPLAYSVIYKVAAGDTLASISTTFGVPINTIVEFNPSVNFSSLIPGISIVIPSQNDAALFEG
jgi:LysM repeat protein